MRSLERAMPQIVWPEGKKFAFTVFDDTDGMTTHNGLPLYSFLSDLGFRTTKSVWPMGGGATGGNICGASCEDSDYARWVQTLQEQGFEVGLHGVTRIGATRDEWSVGLEKFKTLFGVYPVTHANHADAPDSIYWGDQRVSGTHRFVYDVLTRFRQRSFHGHRPGSQYFWGDLCRSHIRYVRNFVYADINTLKECPQMPYHDPDRPLVREWFASSEGPSVESFNKTICEANQDRLEVEGGACIMYTHFANGFVENGRLDPRFVSLMRRLSSRPGWYAPVSVLLDYIKEYRGGEHVITPSERRRLERKWLVHKIRVRGTT